MEQSDLELEQRVWQRVSGGTPNYREMEMDCRESAAVFHQLARIAPVSAREELLRLHRQQHSNAETILGIRILSGEEPERKQTYSAADVSLNRGLSQSVRRSLRAFEAYCAVRGEYAPVFRLLAVSERETARTLLRILGSIR